jgi:transcriptional regulator with XRE-family HTH domain
MQDKGIREFPSAEVRAMGGAIREMRARRGLSQEELAWRSGLHRNQIGDFERGEVQPRLPSLLKVCKGLDMPLLELIEVYQRRLADAE